MDQAHLNNDQEKDKGKLRYIYKYMIKPYLAGIAFGLGHFIAFLVIS